ncbi:hypothetical protein Ciccas_005279 [Cichlidogyrus casuarinus]|uniref:V-type proton ATPase subunit G n=1 Tax=Cichlidogyrus casuarinus TaxID=1844966 RepID=A0ABD2Q941_9PLAT
MSSTNASVQLNQAKKNATAKIEEARARKQKRIKEAKDLAKAEIEAYKLEREDKFRIMEKNLNLADGASGQMNSEYLTESLHKIESNYKMNKEQAIEALLYHVLNVTPELHTNFKTNVA